MVSAVSWWNSEEEMRGMKRPETLYRTMACAMFLGFRVRV